MPALRSYSGLTLRALSPSHYVWACDERLQFKFDGDLWWLIVKDDAQSFYNLASACAYAAPSIHHAGLPS